MTKKLLEDLGQDVKEHGEYAQIYYYPTKERYDVRLPKFDGTPELMMGQGSTLEEAIRDLHVSMDAALDREIEQELPDTEGLEEPEETEDWGLEVGVTGQGKDHLFDIGHDESLCRQVDRQRRDFVFLGDVKERGLELNICKACLNAADKQGVDVEWLQ